MWRAFAGTDEESKESVVPALVVRLSEEDVSSDNKTDWHKKKETRGGLQNIYDNLQIVFFLGYFIAKQKKSGKKLDSANQIWMLSRVALLAVSCPSIIPVKMSNIEKGPDGME